MHPKLQLHIKGPLANLCFSFKADYSLQVDGKPVRRVITSCKRYQAPAGTEMPCILPDFESDWYETHQNVKKMTMESGEENSDFHYASFHEILQKEIRAAVKKSSDQVGQDPLRQHGLRCFKITNREDVIMNISNGQVPSKIYFADYESGSNARIPFQFAKYQLKDPTVREVDKVNIRSFSQELPPYEGLTATEGFPLGFCEEWMAKVEPGYIHVLMGLLTKVEGVDRPDDSQYLVFGHNTLKTDEEILSKLPEVVMFTDVVSGVNPGINIIIITAMLFYL